VKCGPIPFGPFFRLINGSENVYLGTLVEVIFQDGVTVGIKRGEIVVMLLGFLGRMVRGLVIKAAFLGVAFGVVKYGPNLYAQYVGPLPPALQEAHKYTDFNEVYKTFGELAKKMPN
jgi:hypothetical protein